MNIIAKNYVRAIQTHSSKVGGAYVALPILILLTACVTKQTEPDTTNIADQETSPESESTGALFFPVPSASGTPSQPTLLPDPPKPGNPSDFALDLVELMGSSPGKCGDAAENSPQVIWTCAEYTSGLSTFIAKWDKLIRSAEVSLNHSYIATSDWMYFEVDGEIDFFWKTYDLETTQALVAYDPSETGNELIIGLNPLIGNQFAAANGSHSFTNSVHQPPDEE